MNLGNKCDGFDLASLDYDNKFTKGGLRFKNKVKGVIHNKITVVSSLTQHPLNTCNHSFQSDITQ